MKKRLLILPLLAGLSLAGCSLFGGGGSEEESGDWIVTPKIEGGSAAERNAILTAINDKSACVLKGGSDLFPVSTNIQFNEDEQDYIRVLNHVTVDDLTVDITWEFDESQPTFDSRVAVDANADVVYIKYPGAGNANGTFTWKATKIKCGGAVSTETNCNYTATVLAGKHVYHPMTIESILAVHDEAKEVTVQNKKYNYESTSDIINYEAIDNSGKYSPWWNTGLPQGTEDNYIFTEVKGKIIYLSEDGNWGLLANGNHVVEIYSGSEKDLNKEMFPEIANEYVTVKGEVGHYFGNYQVSYIKSIRACAKSDVAEPTLSYLDLTEAKLTAAKLANQPTGTNLSKNYVYKQFTSQFEHNALATVTGTITGDKVSGSNGRFTFELTVGSEKMEVAYDYHSDFNSKVVKNALEAKYSKGSQITISGTLRFSHGQEKTLVPSTGAGGNWSIVPFAASHIA